jgi:hypothetical protein
MGCLRVRQQNKLRNAGVSKGCCHQANGLKPDPCNPIEKIEKSSNGHQLEDSSKK